MLNIINSSSIIHYFVLGTSNSSTTAIWIVNEQNSTPSNIDVYQASIRTMWYRFLLIIIIFVTAAGNVLVCLAIARERKLQNTTNYFLMSLAIADCLVAILVMPMGMIAEIIGHFPLPHYACIIFATMDVLCCTSSIWHMSTMSMDRYFTIRFPFRYGRNKTRRIMLLKIVAVWAISTAVSSPVFVLGIVDKQNVLSNGVCAPNNESFKLYGSIFAFYIPFIIMITTYALTMRSLRNVLVNKRKYNRERRLKQTFRPLAQIINQYAEIAQNIRRSSTAHNQTVNLVSNNNTNSVLNKTPYTIITSTTTSPTQFHPSNNSDMNLIQDSNNIQYGSIKLSSGTNMNNEHIHHNNQHLTISYIKSSGSKKRRAHQQQTLTMNTGLNRTKNDCDMSTVYEISEYSKSTSDSYESTLITNNSTHRRSIVTIEEQHQSSNRIDNIEQEQKQQQTSPITTSTINSISPVKEEDASSMTDIDSGTEGHESTYMQIVPSTSIHSSIPPSHSESISLENSIQFYFPLIQYILQYYIFIFPYRSYPLSIKSSLNTDQCNSKPVYLNQSTSISSMKISRTVSTQTNSVPPLDLTNIHLTNTNEIYSYSPVKRRKFPVLTTSSLFTNFFRHSPRTILHSRQNSNKSSTSLNPHSSAASSSCPLRQQRPAHYHSSTVFRQIESEMDHVLANEHRPRASSSSSSTAHLHTTYRQGSQISSHWHRPLRRRQPHQSRSSYFITNPHPHSFRQQQYTVTSTTNTNTNSSDSSSVFHRFNPRVFSSSTHSQQSPSQRLNDEHIVAANERKALRVLMIIFCVFVTLWTPFFICTFISAICDDCRERISSTIWFSITWLGYSSSMANPFIYTIFSDVFRRAFTNILCCRPSDSLFPRQFSTKLSHPKGAVPHQFHHQLSYRRSPNHEHSGTSTPIQLNHPIPISDNDGTVYINRCVSDSFR
ncbi:unnamed protein product [Adineta steineri]|uniref:G-protein coupled receptors family 1 profile domain-containing protein n=1 Tax=Adineta steineri TaxID=433720 RepID=A0A815XHC0_9BILA|nr:unnamed protein product [Adineta steineri]CAF1557417.1 unnamed protein product [Adineta steineri]CAF1558230.1 unnamed protein product [Adineta steineri]